LSIKRVPGKQTFAPETFINRELSWLDFNARVLEEAQDPTNPLLERIKFLSIFSTNLDEFFMVRISGLREQALGDGAPQDYSPDGMTPEAQLAAVAVRTQELVAMQYRCWNEQLLPELSQAGLQIVHPEQLTPEQHAGLDQFFQERVFPVVTPMAIDPSHPSPLYHNRGLYLATILIREGGLGPKKLFAVVQLPAVLPRLLPVPAELGQSKFLLLEEAIASRLPQLFGACQVQTWTTFRVTRDSDIELLEQEGDDMLQLIEKRLKARRRGEAVRLEVNARASDEIVAQIVDSEDLHNDPLFQEVYRVQGPVHLGDMMELVKLPGFANWRDAPLVPRMPPLLKKRGNLDLFQTIRQQDIVLHHPYDAFDPVIEFIASAAKDPQVLAIKQTLYRTGGGNSPLVKALMEAAENGKHVTAMVELKARFDEETNVEWARQMERAGVHVVFGFLDIKTHCKVSLVIRKEGEGLRRYVHLSTGNYNPITSRIYTDIGLFTCNEQIAADATALFNFLTGYSQGHRWNHLVVAPTDLFQKTMSLIEEQAERAKRGQSSWIFAKLNALVDHRVVEALYQASQAGVPIDLVIRGICCLRPGLPGISENIRVRSILDRFLEHSRIHVFGPPDDCQVFLSSADWMPRNLNRRVEVMFPLLQPSLKERIVREIIPIYLRDNTKSRLLQADGTYFRAKLPEGTPRHRAQMELMEATCPPARTEPTPDPRPTEEPQPITAWNS